MNSPSDGDQYLKFIKDSHFHYDSSMLFKSSALIWPFTLNHAIDQSHCLNCPQLTRQFDALWEFPMHQWMSSNSKLFKNESRTCFFFKSIDLF